MTNNKEQIGKDKKSYLPVGTTVKLSNGKVAKVLARIKAPSPEMRYALEIEGEEYPAILLTKSSKATIAKE